MAYDINKCVTFGELALVEKQLKIRVSSVNYNKVIFLLGNIIITGTGTYGIILPNIVAVYGNDPSNRYVTYLDSSSNVIEYPISGSNGNYYAPCIFNDVGTVTDKATLYLVPNVPNLAQLDIENDD